MFLNLKHKCFYFLDLCFCELEWVSWGCSHWTTSHMTWNNSPSLRFGKSTHISMISNSVTHLRSYTNSAIAFIAGNSASISPVTPCDCQRLRNERRRLCIERRYRHIEWRVFHDVSQCFKSVWWCFTSGSRCFTMYHNVLLVFHDVLLCLTMFYDV